MRELVLTPKFRRAYRHVARRDRVLQGRLEDVLRQMQVDVFHPSLGTHKLSGGLEGLWACSCGYDCRIVFALEIDQGTGREVILLLDMGTHEEVY
jgi:mRNA interferase YafQ